MSTLRASLAKWAMPLTGVYLVAVGIVTFMTGGSVVVGALAILAGVCCLCAS